MKLNPVKTHRSEKAIKIYENNGILLPRFRQPFLRFLLLLYLIFGSALFLQNANAQTQMEFWNLPPNLVSFSSSTPTSSPLITNDYYGQTASTTSNCMYDKNGQLLFFMVDYEVFDGNGFLIDYLQLNGNWITPGTETCIVPVPGDCSKFYIIGSYLNNIGNAWIPFYTLIDMTLPNLNYPTLLGQLTYYTPASTIFDLATLAPPKAFDDTNFPNSERNRFGLAVSPYRPASKDHFLFMKGFDSHSLYRYLISATGIVFDATAADGGVLAVTPYLPVGGDGGNNAIYPELELVDLHNGFYLIGWVSGGSRIFIADIYYSGGDFVANSARSVALPFVSNFANQIVGLEFSPNGDYVYYTYRKVNSGGGLVSQHIGFVNLTLAILTTTDMPNSSYPLANTLGYSYIEMGYDGKLQYTNGNQLMALAHPNTGPLVVNWGTPVSISNAAQFLPDQMDGETYHNHLPPCESCSCGSYFDMTYRPSQGAPNFPIYCGDTLFAGCMPTGFNWTLGGNFQCLGDSCQPQSPMTWTLIGPPGVSTQSGNMSASPGFGISLPSAYFTTGGIYKLQLSAICGSDTCYCHFTINAEGCPCCTDSVAFFNAVANFQYDGTLGNCTIFANGKELSDCMQVTWSWGDGHSTGPVGNATPVSHFYTTGTGNYKVCYLIEEVDSIDHVCWNYQQCDSVYVICDPCVCDSLQADVDAGFTWTENPPFTINFIPLNLKNNCDSVLWTWGDGSTSSSLGTSTVTHIYPAVGIYSVCMIVTRVEASGKICQAEFCINITVTGVVGARDIETIRPKMMVYPNPTNGQIFADFSAVLDDNREYYLLLQNIQGQNLQLLPVESDQMQMDLAPFSAGLYFLSLCNRQGKILFAPSKIVKQ